MKNSTWLFSIASVFVIALVACCAWPRHYYITGSDLYSFSSPRDACANDEFVFGVGEPYGWNQAIEVWCLKGGEGRDDGVIRTIIAWQQSRDADKSRYAPRG